MTLKSSNHQQAPKAAAFVKTMREFFGEDVKVLYVKEGSFELGEREGASSSAEVAGDVEKAEQGNNEADIHGRGQIHSVRTQGEVRASGND